MQRPSTWFLALFLLFGFVPPVVAGDTASAPAQNVMAIIKSHSELSKFAEMIETADLQGLFEAKGDSITVFAPDNKAVENVPSDIKKRLKDKAQLQVFLKHHVISGSVVFSSNIHGRRASPSSANGDSLNFDGLGKTNKVEGAELVTPDLTVPNGVVHIINNALIPESFKEQPAKAQEQLHPERLAAPGRPPVPGDMMRREIPTKSGPAAPQAQKTGETSPSAPQMPKLGSDKPEHEKVAEPVEATPSPDGMNVPVLGAESSPAKPVEQAPPAQEKKKGWGVFGW